MAIIFPKINSGLLVTDLSFLQEGYEYGINDTGPFQKLSRRGRNSDIENWANILANAGWNVRVIRERVASLTGSNETGYTPSTADYGISRIEAEAGWPFPYVYGTETPENIVEMEPADEQKNLLEADFPNANTLTLTSKDTRSQLSKIIANENYDSFSWYGNVNGDGGMVGFQGGNNPSAGTPNYLFDDGDNPRNSIGSLLDPTQYHLPSADYPAAHSFFLLEKAGVDAFPVEASVIRHSIVTSNQYAVQASYNNVNRIISSASMISIEGISNQLLFGVPTSPSPSQFIENGESSPGAGDGDLQYGWRKVRPAVSRLNRMKWRVQQNYQFGLWAIKLYGAVL